MAICQAAVNLAELDGQYGIKHPKPYFDDSSRSRTWVSGPPEYQCQHDALAAGFMALDEFEAVDAMIRSHQLGWKPCLQHRDFIPQNLLWDSHGLVIIDAEHAMLLAPRFEDVARLYVKLVIEDAFLLASSLLRLLCLGKLAKKRPNKDLSHWWRDNPWEPAATPGPIKIGATTASRLAGA